MEACSESNKGNDRIDRRRDFLGVTKIDNQRQTRQVDNVIAVFCTAKRANCSILKDD